jgi:hypothetical protein
MTVCLDQQWHKLGSLRMNGATRRRALGRLWCLRTNPQRCWVAPYAANQISQDGEKVLMRQGNCAVVRLPGDCMCRAVA